MFLELSLFILNCIKGAKQDETNLLLPANMNLSQIRIRKLNFNLSIVLGLKSSGSIIC